MDLKTIVLGGLAAGLGALATNLGTLPVIGAFAALLVTLVAAFEAWKTKGAILKPSLTKQGIAALSLTAAFGLAGLAGILSVIGMANPLAGWSAAGFAALAIILSLI